MLKITLYQGPSVAHGRGPVGSAGNHLWRTADAVSTMEDLKPGKSMGDTDMVFTPARLGPGGRRSGIY
jgi:hypothetical protein